jgi:hypothetical protein
MQLHDSTFSVKKMTAALTSYGSADVVLATSQRKHCTRKKMLPIVSKTHTKFQPCSNRLHILQFSPSTWIPKCITTTTHVQYGRILNRNSLKHDFYRKCLSVTINLNLYSGYKITVKTCVTLMLHSDKQHLCLHKFLENLIAQFNEISSHELRS